MGKWTKVSNWHNADPPIFTRLFLLATLVPYSVLCNDIIICNLLLQLRFPSKHLLCHCLSLPESKHIHLVLLLLIGFFDLQMPASTTNSAFYGEHVGHWGIKRKSWFHLLAINIRLFMHLIDCTIFSSSD